jgi:hypothetical protein
MKINYSFIQLSISLLLYSTLLNITFNIMQNQQGRQQQHTSDPSLFRVIGNFRTREMGIWIGITAACIPYGYITGMYIFIFFLLFFLLFFFLFFFLFLFFLLSSSSLTHYSLGRPFRAQNAAMAGALGFVGAFLLALQSSLHRLKINE